uniref:Uncharacterized protein n=1 Tax=Panagrolaimus sp. ES5 TaxID=591445 RepID=A0AC34G334_9BILA
MNNGFVITSQQFFEELSGIKAAVQESPDRSLSEKNPARNTFIKEEINSNFELTQNALNATTKVAKDEKRQEHGNMDNSSSTTMTLLAATYSSQDAIKDATTDKDMSCVTLDNEPSLP